MSSARNDSPSDPESKACRVEAGQDTVVFLTPGKNPEEVVLLDDTRIIYSDQNGNRTVAHGH